MGLLLFVVVSEVVVQFTVVVVVTYTVVVVAPEVVVEVVEVVFVVVLLAEFELDDLKNSVLGFFDNLCFLFDFNLFPFFPMIKFCFMSICLASSFSCHRSLKRSLGVIFRDGLFLTG